MVPKMALIRGNGGLNIRFYVRESRPRKGTSLGGAACFGVFCVKIRPGPLAVASCKNPLPPKKKTNTFWCAKPRMRRNDTPGRIVTNFCTGVGVHDVITGANLYYDRLRGLGVAAGGLAFSIDLLRRPYNTLALLCECVIIDYTLCSKRNM